MGPTLGMPGIQYSNDGMEQGEKDLEDVEVAIGNGGGLLHRLGITQDCKGKGLDVDSCAIIGCCGGVADDEKMME